MGATPNVTSQLREAESVSGEILTAEDQAGSDLVMSGCKDKGSPKRFFARLHHAPHGALYQL